MARQNSANGQNDEAIGFCESGEGDDLASVTTEEAIEYLWEVIDGLRCIAGRADLGHVSYLLHLTQIELEDIGGNASETRVPN